MHTHLNDTDRAHSKGLWLIGIVKIFKASVLIILALGALSLIHKDLVDLAERLIHWMHIDPDNKYVNLALYKIGGFDPAKLRKIGAGTIFYACLMMTEGVGLALRKRWAEWFTIIATCVFIPLEIYEIFKHVSPTKIGILALNLLVVAYLIHALYDRKSKEQGKS